MRERHKKQYIVHPLFIRAIMARTNSHHQNESLHAQIAINLTKQ